MLTVSIDPTIPAEERSAAFTSAVRRLRSIAAATATAEQLPDLIRTVDAGRLLVALEVYAELDDDEGLLVTEFEPDDLDALTVEETPEEAPTGPDAGKGEENGPEAAQEAGDGPTGDETGNDDGATPDGTETEVDVVDDVEALKGEALDEALKAAGLSTSGRVADKRARLVAARTTDAGTTGTTNTEE